MINRLFPLALVGLLACDSAPPEPAEPEPQPEPEADATPDLSVLLDAALAADHRSEDNRARDAFRHPKETLTFCGLEPDMTVLEISPSAGWYSEILAPVLAERGTFVAAAPAADGAAAKYRQRFVDRVEASPEVFSKVQLATFQLPDAIEIGEPGSIDFILNTRNTHGWVRGGNHDRAFEALFEALRPGGVLCLVQHRAPDGDDTPIEERAKSGYLPQAFVVEVAENAGFVVEETSEVNANPKDTADHPKGVWTLPPGLALGEEDREKYVEIGESDRMTLRLRKPAG